MAVADALGLLPVCVMCADKQVILMEQRLVEYSQSLSQAANMGLGEINPQIRYTHVLNRRFRHPVCDVMVKTW